MDFYDQQDQIYSRTSPKRTSAGYGNHNVAHNPEFLLDLSVKYNTVPGQYVHVIGSIPELGNWKDDQVCKLQWTEGHIWRTT